MIPLFLSLLLAGTLLALGVAWFMGRLLLTPPRMNDGKALWVLGRLTPADLELEYEPLTFEIRDERGERLTLAGWWIPGRAPREGRCVVLLHGYADAKVGALAWAPMLCELGWNVLALDLRAHGESGGRYCTFGQHEKHDLAQVAGQLRQLRPEQTRHLVLMGMSMGAAVAAATALLPEMQRELSGVVLECPFDCFEHGAEAHAGIGGMPGGWILRLAIRLAEWRSGAALRAVRPASWIGQIPLPLLLIQSGRDALIDEEQRARLRAASRQREERWPTLLWQAGEAGHLMAVAVQTEQYRAHVAQLLEWSAGGRLAAHATGGS